MVVPSESKIAVVTGSSSGIGRATALELSAAGYSLVLHARRNLAGIQRVASEVQQVAHSSQQGVLCVLADITCSRACADLVAAAFGWQGRVDAWINNAGADVLTGPAAQLPFPAKLERLWRTDVLGTITLSRLVAQRMQSPTASRLASLDATDHDPCIVNLSWDQAPLGMEGDAGQLFGTTKAAIAAFTQSLALSVTGVRVNCVAPGWIQTDWGQTSASSYWTKRATDESLLKRWGRPEDVARTIAWLVSPHSQFINGQFICVNGGRRYYAQSSLPVAGGQLDS